MTFQDAGRGQSRHVAASLDGVESEERLVAPDRQRSSIRTEGDALKKDVAAGDRRPFDGCCGIPDAHQFLVLGTRPQVSVWRPGQRRAGQPTLFREGVAIPY